MLRSWQSCWKWLTTSVRHKDCVSHKDQSILRRFYTKAAVPIRLLQIRLVTPLVSILPMVSLWHHCLICANTSALRIIGFLVADVQSLGTQYFVITACPDGHYCCGAPDRNNAGYQTCCAGSAFQLTLEFNLQDASSPTQYTYSATQSLAAQLSSSTTQSTSPVTSCPATGDPSFFNTTAPCPKSEGCYCRHFCWCHFRFNAPRYSSYYILPAPEIGTTETIISAKWPRSRGRK
jgi:hypothetical protein